MIHLQIHEMRDRNLIVVRWIIIIHILRIVESQLCALQLAVLCTSLWGRVLRKFLGGTICSALVTFLTWCIGLAWLLIATSILLCQGQGARRVASAYGWVTRVFSMVKRAQSFIF
jgi:hypothetical protein